MHIPKHVTVPYILGEKQTGVLFSIFNISIIFEIFLIIFAFSLQVFILIALLLYELS